MKRLTFAGVALVGTLCAADVPCEALRNGPCAPLHGGAFSGEKVAASPDPLVSYVWKDVRAGQGVQGYAVRPKSVTASPLASFENVESATGASCAVRVIGPGVLTVDFGVDLAGWLEIDSPDLAGAIRLGVSEFNVPMDFGVAGERKVRKPERVGTTCRLKTNREYYEGMRFGFVYIDRVERPFTITAVRGAAQSIPINYTGAFRSDNPMLDRIWYAAAYNVRANARPHYLGAILMDRGDRYSWTGDAYPSQAASLVAFSNSDYVLRNLKWTESHPNRIESYELYWIESVLDYWMYTGDTEGCRPLLRPFVKRLDHAYRIFDNPGNLRFFGWDERLGAGFEDADCRANRDSYQLLAIGAWKHAVPLLEALGATDEAEKCRARVSEKTAQLVTDGRPVRKYAMHASADAINAALVPDVKTLCHPDFADRLQRLSYSPFNQHMILKAMAAAGRYEDALASVTDLWGSQVEIGGICGFEVFRPEWLGLFGRCGRILNCQCGNTSEAHPWSAGVLPWLSEEVLGIRPTKPGFAAFAVRPHLRGYATRVAGRTHTPHGDAAVSIDLRAGRCALSVPKGTVASFGLPKEGRTVTSVTLNGAPAKPTREDGEFLYFDNLAAGDYDFAFAATGALPQPKAEAYRYAASFVGMDGETHGAWQGRYGADGYVLFMADEKGGDIAALPDYVQSVSFPRHRAWTKMKRTGDVRAIDPQAIPALSRRPSGSFGCGYGYHGGSVDIRLRQPREYEVALYFADGDTGGRTQAVEMFDLETKNIVAPTQVVRDFAHGVYLIYRYNRSVRFRLNHMTGHNAVISGVFFGQARR